MSRRDTIIIAVLVNAGLLMVLFATAMSSKDEAPMDHQNSAVQLVDSTSSTNTNQSLSPTQEEMDQVLNQYATAPTFNETFSGEAMAQDSPLIPIQQPKETLAQSTLSPVIPQVPVNTAAIPISLSKNSQHVTVTVKKGDYLDKIARSNGTTVNDIMKMNHLDSTQLKIGQELRIPLNGSNTATTSKSQEKSSYEPEYYIVKNGDNPWLIASKNQVKLEDLLRLNNLDDQKAKKLKPGDKLRIR